MDFEVGKPIEGFSRYEVTNFGRVFNIETGREMKLSPTGAGELTVGLFSDEDDRQYRRSVKVLVAQAFVEGETEIFDTPVLRDGDRTNLYAKNIVWRPRWFAQKYIRQFRNPPNWFFTGPVIDTTNDFEYDTILDAAIARTTLCEDIRRSIINETRVWPGGERYIYAERVIKNHYHAL